MTLIEAFVIDNVYIDFGSEIMYGDDQAYFDYYMNFPVYRGGKRERFKHCKQTVHI